MEVKVVARAPEAHCFSIDAWVKFATEQPYLSGTLATLTAGFIAYVIKSAIGQREEMRQLRGALDTAIRELSHRDQPVIDRLLSTIDSMAFALRPAVRQAVAPVGDTVGSLSIGDRQGRFMSKVGRSEKQAIMTDAEVSVDDERSYTLTISELDLDTGACKVRLEHDKLRRFSGKITDPLLKNPNNQYALAMAARQPVTVRAKATLKDGELSELFISDIE